MKNSSNNFLFSLKLNQYLIILHILGIYSLINLNNVSLSQVIIPFVIGYFITMILGVSIGYHRLISHGSFKTNVFWKIVLLFSGMLSFQGSPLFWGALHRNYHHKHADTDKDPHSPKHGLFHSYMGWLWKIKRTDISFRRVPDLLRDKIVLFFHKHQTYLLFAVCLLVGIININWLLYGIILPALITFHGWCMVTSLSHSSKFSYRNYQTKDNSLNIVWLWPLVFGEAWHNNHHGKERNYSTQQKWFEFDPAKFVIERIKQ
jgi:stearoyl-CoA desaturase (delta-9 desaturase)